MSEQIRGGWLFSARRQEQSRSRRVPSKLSTPHSRGLSRWWWSTVWQQLTKKRGLHSGPTSPAPGRTRRSDRDAAADVAHLRTTEVTVLTGVA